MNNILYSVVIPAYNEEQYLPDTLKYLKTVMDTVKEKGEIVVVDNNSSDRTSEIAVLNGARVVVEPHNQISKARNAGAINSTGKYIIFLDADIHVSPELFSRALQMLMHERYCGGGALISSGIENNKIANGIYRLVNLICRSLKIAPGCFIFCTREGFNAIGGFSELLYAAEEVLFSNKLRLWGEKNGLKFRIIDNLKIQSSPGKIESSYTAFLALVSLALLSFSAYFKSLCWYW